MSARRYAGLVFVRALESGATIEEAEQMAARAFAAKKKRIAR